MNRRGLLVLPLALAGDALVVGAGTYAVMRAQLDQAQTQIAGLIQQVATLRQTIGTLNAELTPLRERVGRLDQRWTFSGGGINRKLMPDAAGQPTVEMLEVFSFDRNHAFCRVETNPAPFVMPTARMGAVAIPAGGFYMDMAARGVDQVDVDKTPEGKARVKLQGLLGCHTEVVTASVKVGSRTIGEPASYEIVAVDGGASGPEGDSFAFTALFDEKTAPINNAIFGPKSTFTGQLVSGKVTIQNLGRMVPI
jgi:hypothetical protein